MKKKKFLTIQDMMLIAVFAAVITICSFIQIPLGPIPVTLQTFGVFVTAGILGTKKGFLAILTYIMLGLTGIPIFAGLGGPGAFLSPMGGYITGFVFMTLIIGIITGIVKSSKAWVDILTNVIAMVLGDAVCFAIGTIQFMAVTKTNPAALGYCVIPFIIPDLVKIVIAAIVVVRAKKYMAIVSNV